MARKLVPAIKERPVAETDAEVFQSNFSLALGFCREVLLRPVNWDDVDILKLKRDVALGVQSHAIKLRIAQQQPRPVEDAVERVARRVEALRRGKILTAQTVIEHDDAS